MADNSLEKVIVKDDLSGAPLPAPATATVKFKPATSFRAASLEELLPGYFAARGLEDDTAGLLAYLAEHTTNPSLSIRSARA